MPRFLSLDALLILVPAAFCLAYIPGWGGHTALFIVSALAIIPLAGWMGRATEQLAHRFGEGIGGLLNASFGNAAELIIALMALRAGLIDVVKASLTGSIIGNLLLVMGLSLFAGGLRHERQKFNKTAARAGATALLLSAAALVVPTIFHIAAESTPGGWTPLKEQHLSLAIAIVLILTYGAMMIFTLGTHRSLYVGGASAEHGTSEDEGAKAWPVWRGVIVLLGATVLVAWMSEFLVESIGEARESLGVTEVFVGVVIVAVIGNAAEHSTAVIAAIKNKMDLSLNIAVGSSLQIALFVTPVLVFCSYLCPQRLDLEFTLPEIVAVFLSVLVADQIAGDGESNWLEGVQLLALYLILGLLFYFLPA